jgi:hypothetical protein
MAYMVGMFFLGPVPGGLLALLGGGAFLLGAYQFFKKATPESFLKGVSIALAMLIGTMFGSCTGALILFVFISFLPAGMSMMIGVPLFGLLFGGIAFLMTRLTRSNLYRMIALGLSVVGMYALGLAGAVFSTPLWFLGMAAGPILGLVALCVPGPKINANVAASKPLEETRYYRFLLATLQMVSGVFVGMMVGAGLFSLLIPGGLAVPIGLVLGVLLGAGLGFGLGWFQGGCLSPQTRDKTLLAVAFFLPTLFSGALVGMLVAAIFVPAGQMFVFQGIGMGFANIVYGIGTAPLWIPGLKHLCIQLRQWFKRQWAGVGAESELARPAWVIQAPRIDLVPHQEHETRVHKVLRVLKKMPSLSSPPDEAAALEEACVVQPGRVLAFPT